MVEYAGRLVSEGKEFLKSGSPTHALIRFRNAALLDPDFGEAKKYAHFAFGLERAQKVRDALSKLARPPLSGMRKDIESALAAVAQEAGLDAGEWEAHFGAALFFAKLSGSMAGTDYDLTAGDCAARAGEAYAAMLRGNGHEILALSEKEFADEAKRYLEGSLKEPSGGARQ